MLANAKVMAFIATAQPETAKAFYQQLLGLRLVADTPFALVFDAGGTELRVQKVQGVSTAPYTALGWAVPDIAAAVRRLAGAGIAFERYVGLAQDAAGIWTTPDGAQVAWFKDPDGNTLSLTQFAA